MSFLESFNDSARRYPDKVAIEFIDPPLQRLTYADLKLCGSMGDWRLETEMLSEVDSTFHDQIKWTVADLRRYDG